MTVRIETRTEPPVLRTTELTRRFGSLVAVDALDLAIAPRLIFGLLGSNGAGKTTTIRMLTTLLPPTSGTAEVAGYDIVREPDRVRQHIGYVPQLLSADGGDDWSRPHCAPRRVGSAQEITRPVRDEDADHHA
jgi:ABC-type Mn2+/Zn2+ transport system ATPase subunit